MPDAPLLQLHALVAHLMGEGEAPPLDHPLFGEACTMAFTTFYVDGELRGCVGCADATVGEAVRQAMRATLRDDRFEPLRPAELARLRLELSVLPPEAFEPVAEIRDITLGIHGVKVSRHGRSALFLPQVARHAPWRSVEDMLAACCRKAGLAPEAWRSGARIWRFTATCIADPGAGEA